MEAIVLLGFALIVAFFLFSAITPQAREGRKPHLPDVLEGKAFVTDGDGIRLRNWSIRLAGMDAPEQGQMATAWDGRRIDQGEIAKGALIRKVGGQHVRAVVEGQDHYGRLIATVWLDQRDIGREMVREGIAVAYFGKRYKADEAAARRERRGMWTNKSMMRPARYKREKSA